MNAQNKFIWTVVIKMKKSIVMFIVFQFMVACGGSGGGDTGTDSGGGGNTNAAPVANAGQNVSVEELSSVTLDGSASSDPDGDTITYSWQQLSGSAVTLSDANLVNPTFDAPSVNEDETLVFRLTVTDTSNASNSDEVSIEIINRRLTVDADVIQKICSACHYDEGAASNTRMVFRRGEGHSEYNETILTDFSRSVGYEYILSKARAVISHGGGVQLTCDDEEFATLESFLKSVNNLDETTPSVCESTMFKNINLVDAETTLRRAAIIMVGRLPTEDEISLATSGEEGLRTALRGLMEGENFHEFLIKGANDRLHTTAFINDGELKFLDRNDTYYIELSTRNWEAANVPGAPPIELGEYRYGLAMAPLKLVAYIVENDLPYTEILQADYTMVNPKTNDFFQADLEFDADADSLTFKKGINRGQILQDDAYVEDRSSGQGVLVTNHSGYITLPQAGLLNDIALMHRYPSTDTNVNRGRAKWVMKQFLNFDIEASVLRVSDQADLEDTNNPTLNNPNCTVCHITMDPIAGAFQNVNNKSHYRASRGGLDSLPNEYKNAPDSPYEEGDTWYDESLMLAPGFYDQPITDNDNSLQQLAQFIVADDRFAQSAVAFWWGAIMSKPLAEAPQDESDDDYQAKLEIYSQQQDYVASVAKQFAAGIHGGNKFNLKDLLAEMFMSPWFRASTSVEELTSYESTVFEDVGVGRLLTPEELAAKTKALIGFSWGESSEYSNNTRGYIDTRYNHLKYPYRVLYGGINSSGIVERSRELTALMSNISLRQALSVSCSAVVLDFKRDKEQRLFLNMVDMTDTPVTAQGEAKIKEQIIALHKRFLGESLTTESEELLASYQFFLDSWQQRSDDDNTTVLDTDQVCERPEGVSFEDEDLDDPNYTQASWIRMLSYIMTDYKYLHE